MLGDVGELVVFLIPPGTEEDGPVNYGDEEGIGCDCAVEEAVESLQGAREGGDQGCPTQGVGEGVEGGEEEVETETPEGEDGEVGKGEGCGAVVRVYAGPDQVED